MEHLNKGPTQNNVDVQESLFELLAGTIDRLAPIRSEDDCSQSSVTSNSSLLEERVPQCSAEAEIHNQLPERDLSVQPSGNEHNTMQIKESSDIATSSELALVDGMLTFGDILSDSSSIQGVEAQVVALTTATLETITSISVSDESTLGKRDHCEKDESVGATRRRINSNASLSDVMSDSVAGEHNGDSCCGNFGGSDEIENLALNQSVIAQQTVPTGEVIIDSVIVPNDGLLTDLIIDCDAGCSGHSGSSADHKPEGRGGRGRGRGGRSGRGGRGGRGGNKGRATEGASGHKLSPVAILNNVESWVDNLGRQTCDDCFCIDGKGEQKPNIAPLDAITYKLDKTPCKEDINKLKSLCESLDPCHPNKSGGKLWKIIRFFHIQHPVIINTILSTDLTSKVFRMLKNPNISDALRNTLLILFNNVVGCNFFTIQQTKHLCTEFDFVTLLMACIDGRHINNKLQAIWICDNISRDMAFGRDLLLRSGALCKVALHAYPASSFVPTAAVLLGHLTSNIQLVAQLDGLPELVVCLAAIINRANSQTMCMDEHDKCIAGSTMALLHITSHVVRLELRMVIVEKGIVEMLLDIMVSLYNPSQQVENSGVSPCAENEEFDDTNVYYAIGCLANLAYSGMLTVAHISHQYFFETLKVEVLKVLDITEHAAVALLLNLCGFSDEFAHVVLKSGILVEVMHHYNDEIDHPFLWLCYVHVVEFACTVEDIAYCVDEGFIRLLVLDLQNESYNHVCRCCYALSGLLVRCKKDYTPLLQRVVLAINEADKNIDGTLRQLRKYSDVDDTKMLAMTGMFCKNMGLSETDANEDDVL